MSKNTPLTAAELATALNFPSVATVHNLRRKRKLPVISLGYRTKLYDLDACRAALSKLEVKAL
jgi:hypothetical protein